MDKPFGGAQSPKGLGRVCGSVGLQYLPRFLNDISFSGLGGKGTNPLITLLGCLWYSWILVFIILHPL